MHKVTHSVYKYDLNNICLNNLIPKKILIIRIKSSLKIKLHKIRNVIIKVTGEYAEAGIYEEK